jgi:hypothetical protein
MHPNLIENLIELTSVDKLLRIGEEAVVAYFKVLSRL